MSSEWPVKSRAVAVTVLVVFAMLAAGVAVAPTVDAATNESEGEPVSEPELEIEPFEDEFPDGTAGDDYGTVEIDVSETADVETENLEVELAVIFFGTEQVVFEETHNDTELQNETETFAFDVGSLKEAGSYEASVTVWENGSEAASESVSFELAPADAPTGTIDLEDPIFADQDEFSVDYTFENTTGGEAEILVVEVGSENESEVVSESVDEDGSIIIDVDEVGGIEAGDELVAGIYDRIVDIRMDDDSSGADDVSVSGVEGEVGLELLDNDSVVVEPPSDEEQPKFRITDVSPDKTIVEPGTELEVQTTIENTGTVDNETDVRVEIGDADASTREAAEIDASSEKTITIQNVAVPSEAGEYDIRVRTDNDQASESLTVEPAPDEPGQAEFEIDDPDFPEAVGQAQSYSLQPTIKNVGDQAGTQNLTYEITVESDGDGDPDPPDRPEGTVAVVDDERDITQGESLTAWLETTYGEDVELVTNTELLDRVDEFEIFVIQRFDSDEKAEDFLDAIEDDQGVVYLDSHQGASEQAYPDGIYRLHNVRDNPGEWDSESLGTDNHNPAEVTITADHPLFDGVGEEGDTIILNEDTSSWGSWFDDYSGEVIAAVDYSPSESGEFAGSGIAVDDDKNEVLLSALSYDFFADEENVTEEGQTVLRNAVAHVGTQASDERDAEPGTETDAQIAETNTSSEEIVLTATTSIELEAGESKTLEHSDLEFDIPRDLTPDVYNQTLSTANDSVTDELLVEQTEADIQVDAYFLEPDPAETDLHVGDTLEAEAVVSNDGDRDGEFEVRYFVGEEVVDNETLSVEADSVETYTLEHELRQPGTKILSVNGVDPVQITVEEDSPTFRVTDVSPDETTVEAGTEIDVSTTIENTEAADDETNVEAQIGDEDPSTLKTVEIDADSETTVTLENVAVPSEGGEYDIRVRTDDDQASETLTVEDTPAAEVIDECTTITESGEYVLGQNVSTDQTGDGETCLAITANDVVLDGDGHSVTGGEPVEWRGSNYGIRIAGTGFSPVQNVEIEDVRIHGWDELGTSLMIEDASDVHLDGIVATNNTFGPRTDTVDGVTIEDSTIKYNERAGIQLFDATGASVRDVRAVENARSSGWAGVYLRGDSSDISLTNVSAVRSQDEGVGIRTTSTTSNVTVTDSNALDNDGYGFLFESPDVTVTNVTAHGNEWDVSADVDDPLTVENLDVGRSTEPGTTLSFDAENAKLRANATPPANPDAESIGRYVEVQTVENGSVDVSVQYDDTDVDDRDEGTLALWRADGDEWDGVADSAANPEKRTVSGTVSSSGTVGIFASKREVAVVTLAIDEDESALSVEDGDTIDVVVAVTNAGDAVGTATVTASLGDELGEEAVDGLEPGATESLEFVFDGDADLDGETVTVTSADASANATVSVSTPSTPSRPDPPEPASLAVEIDPDASRTTVAPGESVSVVATLTNEGERRAIQTIEGEFGGANGTEDVIVEGGRTTTVAFDFDAELGDDGERATVRSEDDTAAVPVSVVPAEPANLSVAVDRNGSTLAVTEGETAVVAANVSNVGEEVGGGTVQLLDDGAVLDATEIGLGAGESRTVALEWNTTDAGTGERVLAVATANDTATETVRVTGDGAERSIADAELEPGETTTVSVEAVLGTETEFTLVESVGDGEDGVLDGEGGVPGGAEIELVDDDGAAAAEVRDGGDELVATYADREAVTLVYEVTVPDDAADGGSYAVDGFLDVAGERFGTTGDDAVEVGYERDLFADREIGETSLDLGESTTVAVSVEADHRGAFTVVESVGDGENGVSDGEDGIPGSEDGIPGGAEIELLDDDGAAAAEVRDDGDELVATYTDREAVTLVYEVTVPDDAADGTTVAIDGFVDAAGEQFETTGDDAIGIERELEVDVHRGIDDALVEPGEATTVSVEAVLGTETGFTLVESVGDGEDGVLDGEDGIPGGAEIELVDDDGAAAAEVRDGGDELVATYADRETVTLVYEVAVPDDAPDAKSYAVDGFLDVDGERFGTTGDGGVRAVDVPDGVGATYAERAEIVANDAGAAVEFGDGSPVAGIQFHGSIAGTSSVVALDREPDELDPSPGETVSVVRFGVPEEATDGEATVHKRVPVEGLEDGDGDRLRVDRFADGEWESLETAVVETTDDHVVLETETPGFSYFTVSVEEPEEPLGEEEPAVTAPVVVAAVLIALVLVGLLAWRRLDRSG